MHVNNKHYITVEGSERDRDRGCDIKAAKSNILEVQSLKEVRRVSQVTSHRPYVPKSRLIASGNASETRRDPSPSLTAITAHEDYFRSMETAVLSENHNLKEHNQFLKAQIQSMFERERRYKGHFSSQREKVKQLQALNAQLQQQLHILISSILSEIQRIQVMIEQQNNLEPSVSRRIFEVTPKNSEVLASQTQSTIHKDLEELKIKVQDIYNKKYTKNEESPIFHRSEYKSDTSSRLKQLQHEKFVQYGQQVFPKQQHGANTEAYGPITSHRSKLQHRENKKGL